MKWEQSTMTERFTEHLRRKAEFVRGIGDGNAQSGEI